MTKKVYTIDVDNKNLKVSAGSSSKVVKEVEKKEVENFGIVEINNASACKKVKSNADKGYQKAVGGAKKSVKAKTSKVDDYFDFSFKKSKESAVETKAETKAEAKVEAAPAKAEKVDCAVVNSVKFDNEACQVIRVARMGSLFDCEKRMINA